MPFGMSAAHRYDSMPPAASSPVTLASMKRSHFCMFYKAFARRSQLNRANRMTAAAARTTQPAPTPAGADYWMTRYPKGEFEVVPNFPESLIKQDLLGRKPTCIVGSEAVHAADAPPPWATGSAGRAARRKRRSRMARSWTTTSCWGCRTSDGWRQIRRLRRVRFRLQTCHCSGLLSARQALIPLALLADP